MSSTSLARIGDAIEVYWPEDSTHYAGCVTAFNIKSGRHRVEYFDGDVENLYLKDEQWRLVKRASLMPATVQHLGSILRVAIRSTEEKQLENRVSKKKKSSSKSPVSVMHIAPQHSCARCLKRKHPMSARLLIAYVATRWLRDESRRPSIPVNNSVQDLWVQTCADLCTRYVHDWLMNFAHDSMAAIELVSDGEAEVSWILDLGREQSIKRGLQNYDNWKRLLTENEWLIEKAIMREVSMRFARAFLVLPDNTRQNIFDSAISYGATALMGQTQTC